MPSNHLEIVVGEPVVHESESKMRSGYVTYTLTTTTSLPSFKAAEVSVVRRYSDFLWLKNQLQVAFPGTIIPPLPDKALGRFNAAHLAKRRAGLQAFLLRLAKHPMLATAEALQTFLEDDSVEHHRLGGLAASPTAASSPTGSPSADKSSSRLAAVAVAARYTASGVAEADPYFVNKKGYFSGMASAYALLARDMSRLAERRRALAAAAAKIQQPLQALGRLEAEAPFARALQAVGAALESTHTLTASALDGQTDSYLAVLESYEREMLSVRAALVSRDLLLVKLANARTALAKVEARVNSLKAAPKQNDAALAKTYTALSAANAAVSELALQLDQVSLTLRADIDRFETVKETEVRTALRSYFRSQARLEASVNELWTGVLDMLVDLEPAGDHPLVRPDLLEALEAAAAVAPEAPSAESDPSGQGLDAETAISL